MTLVELKEIRRRTQKPKGEKPTVEGVSPSEINIRQLRAENKKLAKDLNKRFTEIEGILNSEEFGGKIDLGLDASEIKWENMPEEIENIFRPEFTFQPEDITSFSIMPSRSGDKEAGVRIALDRGEGWWNYISISAIARKDYYSGSSFIHCKADIAQVKESREARKLLNDSLWNKDNVPNDKSNIETRLLIHGNNQLVFSEKVLEFVIKEIKDRI